MSSTKPIVLKLGEVKFAQQAWKELEKIAVVIEADSVNREEFLKDLKTKYSNINHIARTFLSVKQTGLFDEDLINQLPQSLKSVSHCGAGYDQVDAHALLKKKIQLSNVPEAVNNATADTHVFLLLGALRNFSQGEKALIHGDLTDKGGATIAHDPEGKTVGIVGLGGIGRNILTKLKPFGFEKFIYHNRNKLDESLENGAEYVSFDELLAQSDIISINVPLNKNTHHLFNDEVFQKVKKGVVIVNTARGSVIDETALIKALKNGTVRNAGLDVLENEPNVNLELVNLPNVLALPHLGTNTVETQLKMETIVVDNIRTAIETGKVLTIVPEQKDAF